MPKSEGSHPTDPGHWEAELRSRIASFPILVFAGLVKNAGKTTALNTVNTLFPDECLGLTSIGYDGEAHDAIYRHPKPSIPVRPGQLILTAERFLPEIPNGYDVLEDWGKHPQFGAWLILRITAPGDFRMAGPSTLSELLEGIFRLRHYGATRIHVDGALNRLSHIALKENTADPKNMDLAVILSTGAALGNTLNEITERTQRILELFRLPVLSSSVGSTFGNPIRDIPSNQNAYSYQDTWFSLPSFLWNQDVKSLLPPQTEAIYLKGALTDSFYLALRVAGRLPRQFIVQTPAHLLLSPSVWSGLKTRGIEVKLLERPQLVMLTLSPWHPFTPIPTERIAEALLPYSHVPLVDIQRQRVWLP